MSKYEFTPSKLTEQNIIDIAAGQEYDPFELVKYLLNHISPASQAHDLLAIMNKNFKIYAELFVTILRSPVRYVRDCYYIWPDDYVLTPAETIINNIMSMPMENHDCCYTFSIKHTMIMQYVQTAVEIANALGVCGARNVRDVRDVCDVCDICDILASKKLLTAEEVLSNFDTIAQKYKLPANATVFNANKSNWLLDNRKFVKNFHMLLEITGLDKYNYDHTVIAGGCFTTLYDDSVSDVDLFIMGNATQAIWNFVDHFGGEGVKFYMTSKTLFTFVAGKKIQLVLRVYDSVFSLLDSFDLGPACIYYDGNVIRMYEECAYSLATGNIIVNRHRRKTGYAQRLMKYYRNKMFNLVFIDDIEKYLIKINLKDQMYKCVSISGHIISENKCIFSRVLSLTTDDVRSITAVKDCQDAVVTQGGRKINVINVSDGHYFNEYVDDNPGDDFYETGDVNYYINQKCGYLRYKINLLSDKSFKPSTLYVCMNSEQVARFMGSGKKYIRIEITEKEMSEPADIPEAEKMKLKTSTFNIIDLYIGIEAYNSKFYTQDIPEGINDIFRIY